MREVAGPGHLGICLRDLDFAGCLIVNRHSLGLSRTDHDSGNNRK